MSANQPTSNGLFAGLEYVNYAGSIYPGIQVHQWNVQMKDVERWRYLIHIASIFFGLVMLFLKVAILVDWLRIFVPMSQRNAIFWIIHALIWSNKIWDPFFEGGVCHIDDNNSGSFASAILNLASDIGILALPQWVIWNLHMTTAKRIGVSLLFVIGIFAVGCGVARFVYLLKILDSSDEVYYLSLVGLWNLGEVAAGFLIIAGVSHSSMLMLREYCELPKIDLRSISLSCTSRALDDLLDAPGDESHKHLPQPKNLALCRAEGIHINAH
ncbi:Uu.00g059990.m01.CDS01 [Anthostomella pinea]|uniref:Uu.00g059990.m01.CDS01 n=1 Tax=Anthostomella pinea TaxID=933095 RepID=A0AAI8YMF9_9PEZI|nr:Uu.00g059990.m01.CDS01 [Anthostomella pinea]